VTLRRRALDDLDWEMRDHIERETQANIERGMPENEARDAAMRAFGSVLRAAEDARAVWIAAAWDQLLQDVTIGLRSMRRYPVAALVAVLSLAAGIGAATMTLTVREAIYQRPPVTYRRPSHLSRVRVHLPDDTVWPTGSRVPAPLYAIWRATLGDALGGGAPQVLREVRTGDRTNTIPTCAVTSTLFPALGVAPLIGRPLPAELDDSGPAPALLSYRAWQNLFDGRVDSIGRSFWIDGRPFVVRGVMPQRFWYNDTDSPIWTPLEDPGRLSPQDSLNVVVRRPEGMTPAVLQAMLQRGVTVYAERLPVGSRRMTVAVSGVEGTPLGQQISVGVPYMLAAAAFLTLLMACANVAVLMIVQWTSREREIAVRAALGAGRRRIVRALLTESMLVAAAGGILGVAAVMVLRGLSQGSASDAVFYDLSISPRIFLFTGLVVLLAGAAVGLAPALHETRRLQGHPLRTMVASDRARQRWRHGLVVVEITVTVALLVQTTALLDGYRRAMRTTMGFDPRPMIVASVENPGGVPIARLLESALTLPGVRGAAASTMIPFGGRQATVRVAATPGGDDVAAQRGMVGAAFFSVLGVPLRSGRSFLPRESEEAGTAIVSESLAARLFRGSGAVGRSVWVGGRRCQIVGVSADHADNPLQKANAVLRIFAPLPAGSIPRIGFVVRTTDPTRLVQVLRRRFQQEAAGNTASVSAVGELVRISGEEVLAATAPLVPLIAVGILLTSGGVYGVLAFAVARRGRELAVRVAVGARGRDLVGLVVKDMLRLTAVGLGLGVGLTFALTRVLRSGGVLDPAPLAFSLPALVVFALAVAAAWLPARRAGATDPVVLLRMP
jgi:putative ABC transport system permease protein